MDNFSISNQCLVPKPFYPKSSVDDDSLDYLGCLDVKSFDLYHRFRGARPPHDRLWLRRMSKLFERFEDMCRKHFSPGAQSRNTIRHGSPYR